VFDIGSPFASTTHKTPTTPHRYDGNTTWIFTTSFESADWTAYAGQPPNRILGLDSGPLTRNNLSTISYAVTTADAEQTRHPDLDLTGAELMTNDAARLFAADHFSFGERLPPTAHALRGVT